MAKITFRAKVETMYYASGEVASVRVKVPELSARHCDMHAFRTHPKHGAYANSNLFPAILGRIKRERLGDFIKMDAIPDGVTVDTTGFLAVVTLDV